MIDFKDVTFIIPINFDSQDRKKNFEITINYLFSKFDTNIIVMESDSNSNEEFIKSISDKISYHFYKNDNTLFHRTKLLNIMTKLATTNIVVNYDIDVLFKVEQYLEARNKILNGCDFCFPYDGHFYDINKDFFHLIESDNIDLIKLNRCTLFNSNSYGGALFFNKEVYMEIGLENENFISWGHEDWERVNRIIKMDKSLCRTDGSLYHLNHSRGNNSSERNPNYSKNHKEFERISNLTKENLKNEILTWNWIN
jgi:hypothetical protein